MINYDKLSHIFRRVFLHPEMPPALADHCQLPQQLKLSQFQKRPGRWAGEGSMTWSSNRVIICKYVICLYRIL
jgi:hypothetical protein